MSMHDDSPHDPRGPKWYLLVDTRLNWDEVYSAPLDAQYLYPEVAIQRNLKLTKDGDKSLLWVPDPAGP